MSVVRWLMDGDPVIRWQVRRDLLDEPDDVVVAERSRVAAEGWGARLLALQDPGGWWGGEEERRDWMRTIDVLALLREWGADPADPTVRAALDRVRTQIRWWQLDGQPFFDGETEPCLNGRILAAGAWFGEDVEVVLGRLLGEQLADGGWNCMAPQSTRSSFHSTICVLEGLLAYERARGPTPAVSSARARGEAYLLDRRLFRSLSTGEVVDRGWLRFAYPPGWHYDVLRALDYLRAASVRPDERVAEAAEVVRARRHQNGRWPLNVVHRDRRVPFDLEPGRGKASRWNTLRAMRVLRWVEAGSSR